MNDSKHAIKLLPCPFCGSVNVDPKGWSSTDRSGPACDDCSGSADSIELWNSRPKEFHLEIELEDAAALRASAPQGDGRAVRDALEKLSACSFEAGLTADNTEAWLEAKRALSAPPSVALDAAGCNWPNEPFTFRDEPGEHNPCYVVMPGGAMLALNHHAGEGVDIARAKFIMTACNDALTGKAEREAVARALFGDGWQCCANLGPYVQGLVSELAEARELISMFPEDEVDHQRDLIAQTKDSALTRPRPGGAVAGTHHSTPAEPQEVPQSYRDTVRRVGQAREKRMRELRDCLKWLDRKGGLGLDIHERIRTVLGEPLSGIERGAP